MERDDLGRYRDRGLLGGARADVEAYGARDASELLVGYALLLEAGRAVVVGAAAAHRPDVARVRLERLDEDGHVELGVVGEHADHAAPVHLGRLEELVGPGHDDLVCAREPVAGGEDGPRVADRHPVAHELAEPRHRAREVYGPEDVHPGRRGERLDEDGHVLHPALALGPEVDRFGAPAFEQTPRRLDHRPVQIPVAGGAGVILRGHEDLPAERPLGTPDHGRHGHGRLLGQRRVPAREQLAHYQSTFSTKMCMTPPHVSPTPKASSSEMP